jgi:hypothetical protein
MHLKYLHYFGNESSESILQEYGILPKDNREVDVLRPKQCPNCGEYGRPDQKFCTKCRLVLSIETFQEALEEQRLDMQEAFLADPEKFLKMRNEAIALGQQQKKR